MFYIRSSICDYVIIQVKGLCLELFVLFIDVSGICPRPGNIDFAFKAFFNVRLPPKMMGSDRECQTHSFLLFTQNSLVSVSPHVGEHICEG